MLQCAGDVLVEILTVPFNSIDHLRQAIMCWGSSAIIPLKYFPGYHAAYVKSDAVHTCRKFEPIREFVSERFNGSRYVERPSGYIDKESNAF